MEIRKATSPERKKERARGEVKTESKKEVREGGEGAGEASSKHGKMPPPASVDSMSALDLCRPPVHDPKSDS